MTTRSSIHAWRIPWTEEPVSLKSMGLQRMRYDGATNTHTQTDTILQYICLKFPDESC